jgi:hypothetical protein
MKQSKTTLAPMLAALVATAVTAFAQQAEGPRPAGIGYATVAAALDAMRAKSGVNASVQSGWTVIEDRSTASLWSFTPPGYAAHPAAVRRTVTQQGNDVFIQMDVLCEAAKPACDKFVAEFNELNDRMRDSLRRRRVP